MSNGNGIFSKTAEYKRLFEHTHIIRIDGRKMFKLGIEPVAVHASMPLNCVVSSEKEKQKIRWEFAASSNTQLTRRIASWRVKFTRKRNGRQAIGGLKQLEMLSSSFHSDTGSIIPNSTPFFQLPAGDNHHIPYEHDDKNVLQAQDIRKMSSKKHIESLSKSLCAMHMDWPRWLQKQCRFVFLCNMLPICSHKRMNWLCCGHHHAGFRWDLRWRGYAHYTPNVWLELPGSFSLNFNAYSKNHVGNVSIRAFKHLTRTKSIAENYPWVNLTPLQWPEKTQRLRIHWMGYEILKWIQITKCNKPLM